MAEFLEIMKALSDESRMHLLKLLLSHDYCVGALAKQLGISESAVSQHLKVMRSAGIIRGDRRGYYTHYWVDREQLSIAANQLLELSQLPPSENRCRKHETETHTCQRDINGPNSDL